MAQNIKEVTPTREAPRVRKLLLSKIKKETIIKNTETLHKIISAFEK